MDSNLFKYVWRNSRPEQLIILGLVVLAQVFYFASLNIPKTIVNDGIEGKAFKSAQTVQFLRIDLPVPGFISDVGSIRIFDGLSLAQWPYLVGMSCLFLVMVTINGLFKKTINTQKGRMGERMLRRLRFQLYDRILLFPPAHFRKVKQAELAGMINNEIEPLGGFIGDAYVQPAFLGGQAITALLFIMLQNIWLGLIVISVLAVQAFIIPRLRRKIVALGKQRQITARQFSGRVAETVDGHQEVHVHAASNYERADIVSRLGRIFHIRFELFQRKFTAKFLNNLLAQMTPFLIYLVGGYFVLFGNMQVGAVVGVLLAYKDLPGPVKELIDWDQQRQDMQQRYEQVIEQFEPDGMLPPELQAIPDAAAPALTGDVKFNSVVVAEEGGVRALDAVTLSFPLGRKVAVVGGAGGGKEVLAQVAARVVHPTGGGVTIGEKNLADLPEAATGSRLSYVGQDVYLLPVTIRENILYGLKYRPRGPATYEGDALRHRELEEREAKRAGNPVLDVAADWVDYEAAGATGPTDIDHHIIEALRVVELDADVYRYGLRGSIDPAQRPDVAESVLKARAELHSRLADPAFAGLVEPFDRDRYNRNMSVAENVLFGTPVGRTFDPDNITANPYMRMVLNQLDLATPLAEMGVEIAKTMVELFADLPAGHPFFEQFSFITAEELPEYRALLTRLSGRTVADLSSEERARLRALPFRYIEARHRLGLIDEGMEQRLLAARHAFAEGLPPEYTTDIEFYDEKRYNGAATLQDNILFGRLVYGQAQGADRVGDLITEVLDGLELRSAVVQVGLDYNVGVAGKRLSAGQRQKVGIARALVKRPDLLVLNEPTAVLDAATQQRLLDKILAARGDRGVLWTLSRTAQAEHFDEVIVMQSGRMTARGAPAELSSEKTYTDLLAAG